MKIKSLKIVSGFVSSTLIEFDDKWNLIWSKGNSQGKTTLLRFLLFSFGYKIPSTKKVDMNSFNVLLEVDNSYGIIKCSRKAGQASIIFSDETKVDYDLSNESERKSYISTIFDIKNNPILVDNLLGAIYIDQEKGWTLLNRGKTIGANSFDIQDFIASITNKDVSQIESQIYQKEKEIKKYSSIFDVVTMSEEQQDNIKADENMDLLYSKKSNKEFLLNEKRNMLNHLSQIEENNKSLIQVIDSCKLLIKHGQDEFVLTKEDISDFVTNQNIIKAKKSIIEIEIKAIEKELQEIKENLKKYEGLFSVEDAGDSVVKAVNNIPINQIQLEHLIEKLKQERSKLKEEKKNIIKSATHQIAELSNLVKEISSTLKVFEGFLSSEGDYLFTHNLKEYSGRILHNVTFSYRLSYYIFLEKCLGIDFPIIIDSPGSAEMTLESVNDLIGVLNDKCKNSQVIVSSIYKNDLNYSFNKIITLENGLLSKEKY